MKPELKLSERQLNTLVYCFNQIGLVYSKERQQRVLKSILDEVSLRMEKKLLDLKKANADLFSKKKEAKFTLKLYEADAIEQYLLSIESEPLNDYDRNCVRLIINKLNQQLA
jgi:hypothetical protein